MKRFRILTFCWISALTIAASAVDGQTNTAVNQNSPQAAVTSRSGAASVRSNAPVSQNVGRGAIDISPRTIYSRQTQMGGPRAANLRPNYSPPLQPLSPTPGVRARQSGRTYSVQPVAGLLARNEILQRRLPFMDRQRFASAYDTQPITDISRRREIAPTDPATLDAQDRIKTLEPTANDLTRHETLQRRARHNWKSHRERFRGSYSNALRSHRHEWHDRDWWRQHCATIVFVNSGYYFLDAGYWYPAWGYDPLNTYYDYDGPIYTYGNLLPDEVIANVQVALQDAGYYFGEITGSLNVETRAALANFQRDYSLPITGAIDQPTIETLGLY